MGAWHWKIYYELELELRERVRGDIVNNPYSRLINHMRTQGAKLNTPYVQIGVVVSAEPLAIKLGDLQIGKENLLIADHLLPSYTRKVSIPLTDGEGVMSSESVGDHGSHTHEISKLGITEGDIILTDGLKVDDVVALTPALELDGQIYIVLARLVSP